MGVAVVCAARDGRDRARGLILGTPTLRLRGDYLAIVTLGFGEIIRLLADNLADITNGPRGLNQVAYPSVGQSERLPDGVFSSGNSSGHANYGTWWFWLGIILMAGILLLVGNLERSRVGRAWVAIRDDEDAAEVMGVNTFRFKLWAFVIGAAIGGLSGALYAGQVQYVAPPSFNIINSMLFLCAVVLGGQGNKLSPAPASGCRAAPPLSRGRDSVPTGAGRSTAREWIGSVADTRACPAVPGV